MFVLIVADEVARVGIPDKVGCDATDHKELLTKWIINFYLNTRMIFACKRKMKEVEEQKREARQLKKTAKINDQVKQNMKKTKKQTEVTQIDEGTSK